MLLKPKPHITQTVVLLGVAGLLLTSSGITTAQTVGDDSRNVVEVPAHELRQIQEELRFLRARDAERQAWQDSIMDRLPETKFDLVGHRRAASRSSSPQLSDCDACVTPGCACQNSSCSNPSYGCKCCGGCYPCQCPLPEAPCNDCPRVSTLNPYFNVNIFGALKLDMLFHGARPISPGTPFFLTPDSPTGLDQNTFDMHARQSTLGAAFTGPQMGSFQSGGHVMAMFFNDAVIVAVWVFALAGLRRVAERGLAIRCGAAIRRFQSGHSDGAPFLGVGWVG